MNDGLRCDLQRLGHWALEGLRLWQGFGLGGLTSLFTVWSSLGSPSMTATSANGREPRLFEVEAIIPDLHIFDGDIKARKRQGYTPGVETVYYYYYYTHTHTHTHTHTRTHTHKHPNSHIQAQPFTDCLMNLCKPMDPSYIFCYGLPFSV